MLLDVSLALSNVSMEGKMRGRERVLFGWGGWVIVDDARSLSLRPMRRSFPCRMAILNWFSCALL